MDSQLDFKRIYALRIQALYTVAITIFFQKPIQSIICMSIIINQLFDYQRE